MAGERFGGQLVAEQLQLVGQLVAFAGLGERMRPEDLPADTATQMGWIYAGLMVLIGVLAALGLRRRL